MYIVAYKFNRWAKPFKAVFTVLSHGDVAQWESARLKLVLSGVRFPSSP